MLLRHIILLSFGFVIINSESQAASGEAPTKKRPELTRQAHKTNLARARYCPKILSGDEVLEFAEGDPSTEKDPKNTLIKENVRLRSALPTDVYKRQDIQKEQENKGGDWALNNEEPMGTRSSLCTYVNSRLDPNASSVKVSAYPKD